MLKHLFSREPRKLNNNVYETAFKKTSYSQSGEDLIIQFIFNSIGIKNPSYIDIGAHHPYYLSNTALLYSLGSRGINVEPDPELFKHFLDSRCEDVNLNIGVDEKKGELDFYKINAPTLNTFSKEIAEGYSNEGNYHIENVIKIKTETIHSIISKYSNNKFPHFLSLDAEGVDDIIVNSIDFMRNFPIVICVETLSFRKSGRGVKNERLIKKIIKEGYIKYADTFINTIFVKTEAWQKKNSK